MIPRRSPRVGGLIGLELDALWDALKQQRLLAGKGQRIDETPEGIYLRLDDCCTNGDPNHEPPVGACCNGVDCSQVVEAQCPSPGTWSVGTCSPSPCGQIGACCSPGGSCTEVLAVDCIAPSVWQPGTCTPNPCPLPPEFGRCCYLDDAGFPTAGRCSNESLEVCNARPNSIYQSDLTCLDPWGCFIGACCDGQGGCAVMHQNDCTGTFHLYQTCLQVAELCGPPPENTCCNFEGTQCLNLTEAECAAQPNNGVPWLWTEGANCPSCVPRGSCCDGVGGCTYTFLEDCPSGPPIAGGGNPHWYQSLLCGTQCDAGCCTIDGVQSIATEDSCLNRPFVSQRIWTAGPCPVLGSCCAPDGSCTEVTDAQCNGASIWTQGGVCSPNTCPQPPPPTGSCCNPSTGECTVTMMSPCEAQGNVWTQGGVCDPNPCAQPNGACCNPGTGECTQTTLANCFWGPVNWTLGLSCSPNPCAQPQGACCTAQGCTVTSEANCTGFMWIDGETCDTDICPGKCCPVLGNCVSILTQTDCLATYPGAAFTAGTDCVLSPDCPDRGACCDAQGGCTVTEQIDCIAPSVWNAFLRCDQVNCTPTGTCCLASFQCIDGQTEVQCSQQISQPAVWTQGATCPGNCAAPTGSCCNGQTGDCTVTTQAACSGVWTQGETCSPNPCTPAATGSCCTNGTCSVTEQANCFGTWTEGQSCTPNPCQPAGGTGKCCGFQGQCLANNVTQQQCQTMGGANWFQGQTCASQFMC